MAQRLRAHTALPEDQSLDPGTYTGQVHPAPGGSQASGPPRAPILLCTNPHTEMHIDT